MTSPKEVEIKLELAPTSLSGLKKIPIIHRLRAAPKRTTEVSVYFDTPKRKLHKKGLLLRVRAHSAVAADTEAEISEMTPPLGADAGGDLQNQHHASYTKLHP